MPRTITKSPTTAYTVIGSLSNKDVHTKDKNGVIYAKLEIFAVLPPDNAKIQHMVGIAKDSTPLKASPANCAACGKNIFPFIALTASAITKVAPNATIVAV